MELVSRIDSFRVSDLEGVWKNQFLAVGILYPRLVCRQVWQRKGGILVSASAAGSEHSLGALGTLIVPIL